MLRDRWVDPIIVKVDGYGSTMRLGALARIYSDAHMNRKRFSLGGEGFAEAVLWRDCLCVRLYASVARGAGWLGYWCKENPKFQIYARDDGGGARRTSGGGPCVGQICSEDVRRSRML